MADNDHSVLGGACDDERDLILVLQMAKVASSAWRAALGNARPDATVWHLHCANRLTRLRLLYERRRAGFPVDQPGGVPSFWQMRTLETGLSGGRSIRIFSGIRDPVDRAVSLLFHIIASNPSTPKHLYSSDDVDGLVGYFRSLCLLASRGTRVAPLSPFDRHLIAAFLWYRTWFDTEISSPFGLATGGRFDRVRRVLIEQRGPIGLLVYRFEDLKEGALPDVLAAASEFADAPVPSLPAENRRQDQPAAERYAVFRNTVRLPRATLDFFYDAPIVRTFYSDDEIAGFRTRWEE